MSNNFGITVERIMNFKSGEVYRGPLYSMKQ